MSTLLSEKDKHLQRLISQASTLSQFGDFSLYKEIYGPEKAAELERAWCAKNPELALSMGKITPEQFQAFTGRGLYGGNIVQNRNSRWGKRRKKYYGKESSVSSYVDTRHQGDSHRLIMDR